MKGILAQREWDGHPGTINFTLITTCSSEYSQRIFIKYAFNVTMMTNKGKNYTIDLDTL